ncbi:MAG: prepilin-type N-terminal cleavage/methylation domain-containing protein [Vulcanimicrobiota bacterium]
MTGMRGFTLLETMLALALASLVLAATARMFNGYAELMRHSAAKDRELEVARYVLDRVAREISESSQVTPAANTVTLVKPAPNLPIPAAPIPVGFDPADPSRQVTVVYRFDGQRLWRQTGGSEVLSEGLNGFGVASAGQRHEITVTLVQKTKVTTLRQVAFQWVAP